MKIMILGANGQLGRELLQRAALFGDELSAFDLPEVDITQRTRLAALIASHRPAAVINCAAYTQVDRAEEDRERCYAVNCQGPAFAAEAVKAAGGRLIHISTDYVFPGNGEKPLKEQDPTSPIGVYGASKLAGEEELRRILGGEELIVRTSSLHGRYGPNFVHTMLELMQKKESIRVVHDQIMSPTWAGWLAETLLRLARTQARGVLHACGRGAVCWHDFALAIQRLAGAKRSELLRCRVERCTAEEFKRPAPRPAYSVFDCAKLTETLGTGPISWEEGLQGHLADLGYCINNPGERGEKR